MAQDIRVTVWNEFRHEKQDEHIGKIYPDGIHGAIAEGLNAIDGITATTATLDEPEHGLTDEVIANTDVFVWWGHMAHNEVDDAIVAKVQQRVLDGAGIIVLHSGHFSKIFKRLMGTSCNLKWREADEKERLWVVSPGHPIVEGSALLLRNVAKLEREADVGRDLFRRYHAGDVHRSRIVQLFADENG